MLVLSGYQYSKPDVMKQNDSCSNFCASGSEQNFPTDWIDRQRKTISAFPLGSMYLLGDEMTSAAIPFYPKWAFAVKNKKRSHELIPKPVATGSDHRFITTPKTEWRARERGGRDRRERRRTRGKWKDREKKNEQWR